MTRPSSAQHASRPARNPGPSPVELPAWPVLGLLWGVPVFWVTGLFSLSSIIMAVPMVIYLCLHRPWVWTPGILPLLAFVIWSLAAGLMLEPGDLLGWMVGVSQLISVAVLLVYVVNAPERLTKRRLLLGLSVLWGTVVAGGYLGLLFPDGSLVFTVGDLLPGGIASNSYVQTLVYPNFAEVQTPFGADQPIVRPSAPFSFANGWGAGMAVLTPIAIATAAEFGTIRAYALLTVGLAAAVPPSVASQNRGFYLAMGLVVAVVALRLAWRGRIGPVVLLAAATAAAVLGSLQLGILEILQRREEVAQSSVGRQTLYEETFTRTLDSPLLGYGAPRESYFSEITVGTQGAVWNAMFTSGFVGLALFVIFLVGAAVRGWPARSTADLWLSATLLGVCLMSTYYGLDRHLIPLGIVLGVLLRQRYLDPADGPAPERV